MRRTCALFLSTIIASGLMAGAANARDVVYLTPELVQDDPRDGVGRDPIGEVIAPEKSDSPTLTVYGNLESNRIFVDQAFELTTKPVATGGVTLCSADGTLCGDVWAARSLSGRSEDRETDVVVWKDIAIGESNLQVKGGYFELPGFEVWDAKATFTHELDNGMYIAVSGEVMRGGFLDEVARVELGYSRSLGEKLSLNAAVGVSYTTSSDVPSFTYEAAISYELTESASASAFVKGYTASIDSAVLLGIGATKKFNLGW